MERANLRELMESEIPKVDSFLPISQFDVLYKSLNPQSREPWYLGDAVCALIFREEGKITRIYRGNPLTWGHVARRLALGELGIDAIAASPLGSGVLTEQMVAELEAAEFEAAEFEAKKVTLASVSQWAQPESPPVNNRPRSDVQRGSNHAIMRPPVTVGGKPARKKVKKKKESKTRTRRKSAK